MPVTKNAAFWRWAHYHPSGHPSSQIDGDSVLHEVKSAAFEDVHQLPNDTTMMAELPKHSEDEL